MSASDLKCAGQFGTVDPAGMRWRGAWAIVGSYNLNDCVIENNDTWICVNSAGSVGVNPTTPGQTDWEAVSSTAGGGGTIQAPLVVDASDGSITLEQDVLDNVGIVVNAVNTATRTSYISLSNTNGSGTVLGYANVDYDYAAGGNSEASLYLYAPGTPGNGVASRVLLREDGVQIGQQNSGTPQVFVLGSSGLGQVYDTLYNPVPTVGVPQTIIAWRPPPALTPVTAIGTVYQPLTISNGPPIVTDIPVSGLTTYTLTGVVSLVSSSNMGGNLMTLSLDFGSGSFFSVLSIQETLTSIVQSFSVTFEAPAGATAMSLIIAGSDPAPGPLTNEITGELYSLTLTAH